ncbi:heavy metal-associated isoprenylated plant protein 6-like isoform X1 [Chenopodium quinoa]|uniref:heavy metal-associated isoprenylated plant protein 6-like isoform X1 n=2 Tax=Chenopodium quinoa TaxID=63459 RepID=UPI000B79143A|nr:heavy metal-associated isoprenylated plant protein 6-like isoform X1 [Chenopodium quinoa]XP_021747648.1 heavy metal-associated isoprenylated plant protein 6-like isoform X1 [Chenopodium quinoa]
MGEKKDGDQKNNDGPKKGGGGGGDGGSTTVVLKFDMHCEGCAKKVRRSIKNFNGVESIKTDCSAGKLTVVGKVDPVKIKERVEEKTKKKVELLSFQPNKPPNKEGGAGGEKKSDGGGGGGEKKSEAKSDVKKSEDKKEKEKEKPKEPQVATVLLKTRVHCEGCAQKIKKIVAKCDGVQDVNVDLQKDTITVKGSMNMKEMLPYLNVKLKRNVELAAPAKKDEGGGGDKKGKEGGGGDKEKPKEGGGGASDKPKEGGEKAKGGGENKEGGGGGGKKDAGEGKAENVTKIEVNKMEYNPYAYGFGAHAYTYDPRQHGESSSYSHQVTDYWHEPEYSQPPQMFSDENPNACSIM